MQAKRTVVLLAPVGRLKRMVSPSPMDSTFNSAAATVVVMLLSVIAVAASQEK
jgi:hypothetical protein